MILEGRSVVAAARHKSRAIHNFHHRHLNLNDNLGFTLCADRGRAKNFKLLRACRRLACLSLACDCTFHHHWIPSESNAADAGSRVFEHERIQSLLDGRGEDNGGGYHANSLSGWDSWLHELSRDNAISPNAEGKHLLDPSPRFKHLAKVCQEQIKAVDEGRSPLSPTGVDCGREIREENKIQGGVPRCSKIPRSILSGAKSGVGSLRCRLSDSAGGHQGVLCDEILKPCLRPRPGPGISFTSEPRVRRRLGTTRGVQVPSCFHGPSSLHQACERSGPQSSLPPRLEQSGFSAFPTSDSLVHSRPDILRNARGQLPSRGAGSSDKLHYLWASSGDFQAQRTRPFKTSTGKSSYSELSLKHGARVQQNRPDRSKHCSEFSNLAVVGGPPGEEQNWASNQSSSQNLLRSSKEELGKSFGQASPEKGLCSALSAEALGPQLGQMPKPPFDPRNQRSRRVAVRQESQEVRKSRVGLGKLSETDKDTTTKSVGSSCPSGSQAPLIFKPAASLYSHKFAVELFAGSAHFSKSLAEAGVE